MSRLYEFHRKGVTPEFPCRKKDDVLSIVRRWEDGPYVEDDFDDRPEVDWDQLEQDIHALAHIAMQHLPD